MKKNVNSGDAANTPGESPPLEMLHWKQNPEVIQKFLGLIPKYSALCSEVAYILKKYTESDNIAVANISQRAKELGSFLEKIERKSYGDPFNEITDFAGTRVIVYYEDEIERLTDLIRKSFSVVDEEDRSHAAGVDRFGYGGVHFLVRLSEDQSGARYDDLKDLICEIQVRTVMQDAWATLSHKLLYKREADTPEKLRRNVNALAGALDNADFSFKMIRDEREAYAQEVEALRGTDAYLDVEIDLDTFTKYLETKFPDLPLHFPGSTFSADVYLSEVRKAGLRTLGDLETLLHRTERARDWLHEQGSPRNGSFPEVSRALSLCYPEIDDDYDSNPSYYEEARELILPA